MPQYISQRNSRDLTTTGLELTFAILENALLFVALFRYRSWVECPLRCIQVTNSLTEPTNVPLKNKILLFTI